MMAIKASKGWLKRLGSVVRALAAGLAGLAALVLAIVALMIGLLQIPELRNAGLAAALQAVQSPDLRIRIANIGGTWPSHLALDKVEVADAKGPYLTLEHLNLDWRPSALWTGHLHVTDLEADGLAFLRVPVSSSPTPPSDDGFSLPTLPVAIQIDRLSLANASLGKDVIGQAIALDADASLDWTFQHIATAIAARRRDQVPGNLDLKLSFSPLAHKLSATIDLADGGPGQRGIISQLAGMPDAPSVTLKALANNEGDKVNASLTLDGGALIQARATADGSWHNVWGSNIAALLDKEKAATSLDLDFDLSANGRLVADNLSILSPAGALRAQGKAIWDKDDDLTLPAFTITTDRITWDGNLSVATVSASGDHNVSGHGNFKGADVLIGDPGNSLTTPLEWVLEASSDFATGATKIQNFSATSPGAALLFTGTNDPDGRIKGKATLTTADLGPVGKLIDFPLGGAGTVTLDPLTVSPAGAIDTDVKLETQGLTFHDPALDQILGSAPKLTTRFAIAENGDMKFSDIRLAPQDNGFNLTGKANYSAQGIIGSELRLDAPQDSKAFAGYGVIGALTAKAKADGPADALDLDLDAHLSDGSIQGVATRKLDASVNLKKLKQGAATISFEGQPGKAKLTTDLALHDDGGILIDHLRGDLFGATTKGRVLVRGDGLIEGEIGSQNLPLQAVGAFAGVALDGQANVSAQLTQVRGKQNAALSLTSSRVELEKTLELTGFTATAQAADAFGAMALDASIKADGGGTKTSKLKALSISARGPLKHMSVSAHMDGAMDGQHAKPTLYAFDAAATVRLDTRQSASLDMMKANLGRSSFELAQPFTIDFTDGALTTNRMLLTVATPKSSGRIEAAMAMKGSSAKGDFSLTSFPLSSLEALLPERVRGSISGSGAFDTGKTSADARLSFEGVSFGDSQTNGLPVLNGKLETVWLKKQATVDLVFTGPTEQPLRGHATLPLIKPANSPWPQLPATGPVQASLTWKGRIENLLAPIDLGSQAISGLMDIDLAISGDIAAPIVSGQALITGGSYENSDAGVLISNIDAKLSRKNDQALNFTLTGSDGTKGSLTTRGVIDLDPATSQAINIIANFNKIHLVHRPELNARLDGNLDISSAKLTPTQNDPLTISGSLTIPDAEIRIPDSLPPSVPHVDVIIISGPDAAPPETIAAKADTTLPIMLDMAVHIPGPMKISGRGINSLWRGDLNVKGTVDSPVVSGSLNAMRGSLSFAGKNLSLTKGAVNFLGRNPIDPDLDVRLAFKRSNFNASVNVAGRSSSPEISMSSQPPLPEDEILSHILFDKGVGELSAFEAIQLANALAEVSGGGLSTGSILSSIQQTLGLDVLNFAGSGTSGASVSAGKYVTEDVYLGVRQGTMPGDMAATIEIELTPSLTLESEIGTSATTQAGITWSHDY